MSDPRIIPILDPEPTEQERQHCTEGWAKNTAAERVRIARQAIEWVAERLNIDCMTTGGPGGEPIYKLLHAHDTAIAERGKK